MGTCSDSCSESDAGNSAISPPFIVLRDPPVPTKQEDWDTEPSKGTSSTVFAFDVVDVRSLSPKVQLTVSQNVRVSTKLTSNVVLDLKLRKEQGDWLVL